MINLFTNLILFILRLLNMVTFGILDNLAVVYGVLVLATFYAVIKLDKYFKICDFWRSSGFFIKTLIFTGILFNTLPQWYFWVAGVILVVLAYYLTPDSDEEDEEPSILSRIYDILIDEYNKKGLKNSSKKLEESKSQKLPPRKLPPV